MTPTNNINGPDEGQVEAFDEGMNETGPKGALLESKPLDLPQLAPKPGFRTSQGQLTAVFSFAALILSAVGFKYSSSDVENLYVMIQNVITVVGPLLALIPVLINYINSRGKIQSNALWASASLSTGLGKDGLQSLATAPAQFAGLGKMLGGKNWKDPKRYLNIARIGGSVVPGLGTVTDLLDGSDGADQQQLNEQLIQGMQTLGDNQKALNDKLDRVLSTIKKGG